MESSFKNKVVIVTGGSSGIGKATAIAFAMEGAKVVIADWKIDPTAVETMKNLTTEVLFIQCDVSNDEDVKNMVNKTIETFGSLDYAFNNAGIEGEMAATQECSMENWNRTIEINLKGVWLCMKYQIPEMLKQGKGAIVNCASVAGLVGFAGLPAYVASKHGVIGLTKNAALECAELGIRVNAVCPGVIQTPMIDRLTGNNPDNISQFTQLEPVARFGKPEEIANAVLWLCSEKASFVTGHPMVIDGGFVAR